MSNKYCVVLVSNKKYMNKFFETLKQLRYNGKYYGDICYVYGDDMKDETELLQVLDNTPNLYTKYFPDIQFSKETLQKMSKINRENTWMKKIFQYHKLYLFTSYFKKWDYIFYIDCGVKIYNPIEPLLKTAQKDTLLVHSDAYPTYQWKLHQQFDKSKPEYLKLNKEFNLNINYFQTTIMLYDTNIIEDNTFNDLLKLSIEYPISRTNDQAIIALYYTNVKKCAKQIPIRNNRTFFYDYIYRHQRYPYIMTKM